MLGWQQAEARFWGQISPLRGSKVGLDLRLGIQLLLIMSRGRDVFPTGPHIWFLEFLFCGVTTVTISTNGTCVVLLNGPVCAFTGCYKSIQAVFRTAAPQTCAASQKGWVSIRWHSFNNPGCGLGFTSLEQKPHLPSRHFQPGYLKSSWLMVTSLSAASHSYITAPTAGGHH